jgi:hypothetical protein
MDRAVRDRRRGAWLAAGDTQSLLLPLLSALLLPCHAALDPGPSSGRRYFSHFGSV